MAEFLIRAITNGTGPGNWQRGDIVNIREDGWGWGRYELRANWISMGGAATDWPAGFWVLKDPGVGRWTLENRGYAELQTWASATDTTRSRSVWTFDVNSLPANVRNAFNNNGEGTIGVTLTLNQAQNVFTNKETGAKAVLT